MAVLLRNWHVSACPAAPPSSVLGSLPGGTYTSCKVVRLRSVQTYQGRHPDAFKRLDRWMQREGWSPRDLVSKFIEPPIRQVLQQLRSDPWANIAQEQVGMLLVVLHEQQDNGDESWEPGVEVLVQWSPYTPRPKDKAVQVLVMGGPRRIPHAKYSSWAQERKKLEQAKPPGFDEVILRTERGELLEGLTTNLFIAYRGVDGRPVLRTSGPEQPALSGTMQLRVIEAARELGLTVHTSAPLLAEHQQWTEAFLTNSLAGILPVKRILHGQPPGSEHIDCRLPQPYGPFTQKLQEAVQKLTVFTDAEDFGAQVPGLL